MIECDFLVAGTKFGDEAIAECGKPATHFCTTQVSRIPRAFCQEHRVRTMAGNHEAITEAQYLVWRVLES